VPTSFVRVQYYIYAAAVYTYNNIDTRLRRLSFRVFFFFVCPSFISRFTIPKLYLHRAYSTLTSFSRRVNNVLQDGARYKNVFFRQYLKLRVWNSRTIIRKQSQINVESFFFFFMQWCLKNNIWTRVQS